MQKIAKFLDESRTKLSSDMYNSDSYWQAYKLSHDRYQRSEEEISDAISRENDAEISKRRLKRATNETRNIVKFEIEDAKAGPDMEVAESQRNKKEIRTMRAPYEVVENGQQSRMGQPVYKSNDDIRNGQLTHSIQRKGRIYAPEDFPMPVQKAINMVLNGNLKQQKYEGYDYSRYGSVPHHNTLYYGDKMRIQPNIQKPVPEHIKNWWKITDLNRMKRLQHRAPASIQSHAPATYPQAAPQYAVPVQQVSNDTPFKPIYIKSYQEPTVATPLYHLQPKYYIKTVPIEAPYSILDTTYQSVSNAYNQKTQESYTESSLNPYGPVQLKPNEQSHYYVAAEAPETSQKQEYETQYITITEKPKRTEYQQQFEYHTLPQSTLQESQKNYDDGSGIEQLQALIGQNPNEQLKGLKALLSHEVEQQRPQDSTSPIDFGPNVPKAGPTQAPNYQYSVAGSIKQIVPIKQSTPIVENTTPEPKYPSQTDANYKAYTETNYQNNIGTNYNSHYGTDYKDSNIQYHLPIINPTPTAEPIKVFEPTQPIKHSQPQVIHSTLLNVKHGQSLSQSSQLGLSKPLLKSKPAKLKTVEDYNDYDNEKDVSIRRNKFIHNRIKRHTFFGTQNSGSNLRNVNRFPINGRPQKNIRYPVPTGDAYPETEDHHSDNPEYDLYIVNEGENVNNMKNDNIETIDNLKPPLENPQLPISNSDNKYLVDVSFSKFNIPLEPITFHVDQPSLTIDQGTLLFANPYSLNTEESNSDEYEDESVELKHSIPNFNPSLIKITPKPNLQFSNPVYTSNKPFQQNPVKYLPQTQTTLYPTTKYVITQPTKPPTTTSQLSPWPTKFHIQVPDEDDIKYQNTDNNHKLNNSLFTFQNYSTFDENKMFETEHDFNLDHDTSEFDEKKKYIHTAINALRKKNNEFFAAFNAEIIYPEEKDLLRAELKKFKKTTPMDNQKYKPRGTISFKESNQEFTENKKTTSFNLGLSKTRLQQTGIKNTTPLWSYSKTSAIENKIINHQDRLTTKEYRSQFTNNQDHISFSSSNPYLDLHNNTITPPTLKWWEGKVTSKNYLPTTSESPILYTNFSPTPSYSGILTLNDQSFDGNTESDEQIDNPIYPPLTNSSNISNEKPSIRYSSSWDPSVFYASQPSEISDYSTTSSYNYYNYNNDKTELSSQNFNDENIFTTQFPEFAWPKVSTLNPSSPRYIRENETQKRSRVYPLIRKEIDSILKKSSSTTEVPISSTTISNETNKLKKKNFINERQMNAARILHRRRNKRHSSKYKVSFLDLAREHDYIKEISISPNTTRLEDPEARYYNGDDHDEQPLEDFTPYYFDENGTLIETYDDLEKLVDNGPRELFKLVPVSHSDEDDSENEYYHFKLDVTTTTTVAPINRHKSRNFHQLLTSTQPPETKRSSQVTQISNLFTDRSAYNSYYDDDDDEDEDDWDEEDYNEPPKVKVIKHFVPIWKKQKPPTKPKFKIVPVTVFKKVPIKKKQPKQKHPNSFESFSDSYSESQEEIHVHNVNIYETPRPRKTRRPGRWAPNTPTTRKVRKHKRWHTTWPISPSTRGPARNLKKIQKLSHLLEDHHEW